MIQVGGCSIGAAAGSASACAGTLAKIAEAGVGNCKIGGGAFAGFVEEAGARKTGGGAFAAGIVEEAGAGKTVGGGAFAAGIVEEADRVSIAATRSLTLLMGSGRHGGGCPSFKPEVPGGGCGCGCMLDEASK